jgi:hypothetical protein
MDGRNMIGGTDGSINQTSPEDQIYSPYSPFGLGSLLDFTAFLPQDDSENGELAYIDPLTSFLDFISSYNPVAASFETLHSAERAAPWVFNFPSLSESFGVGIDGARPGHIPERPVWKELETESWEAMISGELRCDGQVIEPPFCF